MFETITSAALSFGNITSTVATTTAFVLDYNATEFPNSSESSFEETTSILYPPCHPEDPDFNCTIEEYLEAQLGAQHMPLETAIWVSVVMKSQNLVRPRSYN